jgi:hypothetical protein
MAEQEKPYLSYLLRLWLVQNEAHHVWRCSLENVKTGERQGFASLEAMCLFLSEKIMPLPNGNGVEEVVQ